MLRVKCRLSRQQCGGNLGKPSRDQSGVSEPAGTPSPPLKGQNIPTLPDSVSATETRNPITGQKSAISTTSRDKVSVFLELFTAGEQPLVWSGRGQLVTVTMDTRTTPARAWLWAGALHTLSHLCSGRNATTAQSLKRPRDEPLQ